MKTISGANQTLIAQETSTLAVCWKVTLNVSPPVVYGFTNHDVALVVDGLTYSADSGVTPSASRCNIDLSVDNLDLIGVLQGLSAADIQSGVYDGAFVELFMVDWTKATISASDRIVLTTGTIGNITRRDNMFIAEVRSLAQALQQTILEVYSPQCRATLGDSRCGVTLSGFTVSGTVTGVTSKSIFTDSSLTEAADYWNLGSVTWLTGNNAGRTIEVKTFAAGVVETYLPMPDTIQIGDTYDIVTGCDKALTTCRDTYSNLINMRAEPYLPAKDVLLSNET